MSCLLRSFKLLNVVVKNARGLLKVASALRLIGFHFLVFDLLLCVVDEVKILLLSLPLGSQSSILFLQVGNFFFGLLGAVLALLVLLHLESFAFNLQLHQAALDAVKHAGHAVVLNPETASSFINQVDRLVWQESVGDVTRTHLCGGYQGTVLNATTVVRFVFTFDSSQNCNGVKDAWLSHIDGLKAPLKCRVLLNVRSIFIKRGGANSAQLAATERRLEQLPRARAARIGASADDGVDLINEQNDSSVR